MRDKRILLFIIFFFNILFSCSSEIKKSVIKQNPIDTLKKEPIVSEISTNIKSEPFEIPKFIPLEEEISPLNELISVSVRGAFLRDVLHSIAETVNLNLVIDKGVDPKTPITVTLREVTAAEALDIIISSTNYFYEIKDNILYVKAMDTKIYEFGHSPIIQTYNINIGGDILSGSSKSGKVSGNISLKGETLKKNADIWQAIEEGLKQLLVIKTKSDESDKSEKSNKSEIKPSYSINRMTGTIVVTATKPLLKKVDKYLKRLKSILNRQVIIEARIVEVRLSEGLRYGINWDSLGNLTYGFRAKFNNFAGIISSSEPNIELSITKFNFNALLRALEEIGEVYVLSNPRIKLMNGQTALLTVGRTTDIITKVETTTSTIGEKTQTTFSIETGNVLSGIMIGIATFIHEDGSVSMTITPIISELVTLQYRKIGKVGENSIEISLPTVDLRELNTTVKLKNGEMVIIGGLISTKEETSDLQVPFLGKIPIVGSIFKSHKKERQRRELVIMLKPTVTSGESNG